MNVESIRMSPVVRCRDDVEYAMGSLILMVTAAAQQGIDVAGDATHVAKFCVLDDRFVGGKILNNCSELCSDKEDSALGIKRKFDCDQEAVNGSEKQRKCNVRAAHSGTDVQRLVNDLEINKADKSRIFHLDKGVKCDNTVEVSVEFADGKEVRIECVIDTGSPLTSRSSLFKRGVTTASFRLSGMP